MKYSIMIIALLALTNLIAASKVRIALEESNPSPAKDFFFSVRARRVYVHDDNKQDNSQNYDTGYHQFVARVRVGSDLVSTDNGSSTYQKMVVDTGSRYSWFESTQSNSEIKNGCSENGDEQVCQHHNADPKLEISSLQFAQTKDGTNEPTTVAKTKFLNFTNVVYLQNKNEVPVYGVEVEYTQKDNVVPKLVNTNYNGVLGFQQNAQRNLVQQLRANNKISNKVFALYFAQKQTPETGRHENFVTVGDYEHYLCSEKVWDTANVRQNYTTKQAGAKAGDDWVKQTNDWQIQGGQFQLLQNSGEYDSTTVSFTEQAAVFDSSTYAYWASQKLIDELTALSSLKNCLNLDVKTKKPITNSEGLMQLNCDLEQLPQLTVEFNDQETKFHLRPEAYTVYQTDSNTNTGHRYLNFLPTKTQVESVDPKYKVDVVVFGRQWMQYVYTIYNVDDHQVLLSNVYLASPDTIFLNQTVMWLIIVFGVLFFVLTFAALLAILQPIKYVPRKEVVVQAVPQQVVYVQNQPAMQQSLVRSQNNFVAQQVVSPNNRLQQVTTPPRYR